MSEPTGASAEAFRIVKNKLEMVQLRRDIRSVVITSTAAGEGKSTVAANLAVTFARSGRHVILLDFDLEHPSIAQLFGLGKRPGLSDVAAVVSLDDALTMVDVDSNEHAAGGGGLEILTVGEPPPDPGEREFLLSSFAGEMLEALAGRCDVLLIDTPPVLGIGDAMTIATRSDGVILVARLNDVRRTTLAEARQLLEACPTFKLGVIATGGSTPQSLSHVQRRGANRRRQKADGTPTRDFFAEPDDTRNGLATVISRNRGQWGQHD